jgi:predicted MPP superfamily phosphohydrolase
MAARIEQLVARVAAPVKVAVLGNHDLWTRHELIEDALERGGARLLMNRALTLPPPHDDVALVGLDDPWAGEADPDAAFAGTSAPVRIALTHPPESFDLVRGRAQLMICGHTHGGQVASPWGPVVVQGPLGRRWPAGLYQIDGTHLFVSRGLGCSDLPLRAFAPPDVALLTLV